MFFFSLSNLNTQVSENTGNNTRFFCTNEKNGWWFCKAHRDDNRRLSNDEEKDKGWVLERYSSLGGSVVIASLIESRVDV